MNCVTAAGNYDSADVRKDLLAGFYLEVIIYDKNIYRYICMKSLFCFRESLTNILWWRSLLASKIVWSFFPFFFFFCEWASMNQDFLMGYLFSWRKKNNHHKLKVELRLAWLLRVQADSLYARFFGSSLFGEKNPMRWIFFLSTLGLSLSTAHFQRTEGSQVRSWEQKRGHGVRGDFQARRCQKKGQKSRMCMHRGILIWLHVSRRWLIKIEKNTLWDSI